MPNLNTSSSLNAHKSFSPLTSSNTGSGSTKTYNPIKTGVNTTTNSSGQPFYKGESNLKELDTPAILRKSGQPIVRDLSANDKADNVGSTLNPFARPATNSIGGTIKSRNAEDREKPAFLRRVMD